MALARKNQVRGDRLHNPTMSTGVKSMAFGAPGIAPRWTSSAKEGLGSFRLWFVAARPVISGPNNRGVLQTARSFQAIPLSNLHFSGLMLSAGKAGTGKSLSGSAERFSVVKAFVIHRNFVPSFTGDLSPNSCADRTELFREARCPSTSCQTISPGTPSISSTRKRSYIPILLFWC
jgi:hypothetical protein